MADLSTNYMGLHLRNPLIVASSSLTKTIEGVERCANAGAGAVVLKSLFEEQIEADTQELEQNVWLAGHTEAYDYVRNMGIELGSRDYLTLIEAAKKRVTIPIIASLNCITPQWWTRYAQRIEIAGADALELNIAVLPSDPLRSDQEIEHLYFRILDEVKKSIRIPIAVKIGPYFTSMARMANELCNRGAGALVLFNRFYQLDINIDKLSLVPGYRLSSPEEMSMSLRWISLLTGRVTCDLTAATGVHDGVGVIKQLLAGASTVQICSTLFINGIEYIAKILGQVDMWMEKHKFANLDHIRGKLSQAASDRPEFYERLQYIKALVGIE
jgi:dihydroorotate dehydrogenase (fumarate)